MKRFRVLAGVCAVLSSAAAAYGADCNRNGANDAQEIAAGRSEDCNANGIPDECDVYPLPIAASDARIAVAGTAAILIADLDGDGRSDIALGASDAANGHRLAVLIHGGGREFARPVEVSLRARIDSLAAIDIDNDGDLDLFGGGVDALFHFENDGVGSFALASEIEFDGSAIDLDAADLDGDGLVDLLLTDRAGDRLLEYRNNGAGALEEPLEFPVANLPRAAAVGDLDGDRDLDVVTVSSTPREVRVLWNDGRGDLSSSVVFEPSLPAFRVAITDFDGDGTPDVAVGLDRGILLLEVLGGELFETFTLDLGTVARSPSALVVADADGDRREDLLVTYVQQGVLTILAGTRGSPEFIRPPTSTDSYRSLAAADFDGDGTPDLAGATLNGFSILWSGEPEPGLDFTPDDYPNSAQPHWSSLDDVDQDGDLDIAIADGGVSTVTVQYNDGDGGLRQQQIGSGSGYVNSVTTADFDGDGDIDVAATSMRDSRVYVFTNDAGRFRAASFFVGGSPFFITDADVDADGEPDIVTGNPGNNSVSIAINQGAGLFGPTTTVGVGSSPQFVDPVDIDGDRDLDLVVANVGNSFSILVNDGAGRFIERERIVFPGIRSLRAIDLDGDRDPDLALTNGGSVILYENRGGELSRVETILTGAPSSWIIAADLDRNGIVDLVTSNTYRGPTYPPNGQEETQRGSLSILVGTAPFRFDSPRRIDVGFDPRSLHAADMNNDGRQDLVVINHDNRLISVLLNQTLFGAEQAYRTSLCTEADFHAISIPARGGARARITKFVTPARPGAAALPTVFQNVRIEPLHQVFLAETFPERFPKLTRSVYDALVHRRATREYFAGNIYLLRERDRDRYGFSVLTGAFDDADELPLVEEVRAVRDALAEVFSVGELVYFPETAAERESAASWVDPGFEVFLDAGEPDLDFEAYTRGVTFGRVRVLDAASFAEANANGRFGFQDILVLGETPRDIEGVVGGVLTATIQTAASHVAVRTARRGTPNAYAADAIEVFAALDGALIRLEVRGDGYAWRSATPVEADAFWSERRPELSELPEIDLEYRELASLTEIDLGGVVSPESRVGGKAANLARLQRILDGDFARYREDGVAIPLVYYSEFLRANRMLSFIDPLRIVTYDEYLAELESSDDFRSDSAFRFAALERLRRAMVDGGRVDAALADRIRARVVDVFGAETKVRFRSSSNAEDIAEFNGAGLYDSFSACAADDLDAGDGGPSLCDPGDPDERGIERALKRVWASLWNFRAYEERAFYGIPQDLVAMGILVTRAHSGEQANGVAFTANPANPFDRRYLVSAQLGEASVVSPEPGVLVEKDFLEVVDGSLRRVDRAIRSSLVPPDTQVLSDERLAELARVLSHVEARFPIDAGLSQGDVLLDFEFKIERGGELAIKQVRPFLATRSEPATPPFSLRIAPGSAVCAAFREFRRPEETWRLKSVIELRAGEISLGVARSFFSAESIVESLRLGPSRALAEPAGPALWRVADGGAGGVGGAGGDAVTFAYEQQFVLADGTPFPLRLDGLRFSRSEPGAVFELDGSALEGLLTLEGDAAASIVHYASCAYEELPLWEIDVNAADGASFHLLERHDPPLDLAVTGPARLVRADVAIGAHRHRIDDYWDLVYTAGRHNVTVEYWVLLDPPIAVPGVARPIRAVEIIAPEPSLGVEAALRYLDAGFAEIASVAIASFTRRLAEDEVPAPEFLRGDVNDDGARNLSDAIALLEHLFVAGASPACAKAADADDDGALTLTDAIRILAHLFLGVATLPEPFAACGEDPTADALECGRAGC